MRRSCPRADVTVRVAYSTLNCKDGLCLTGRGGLVRNYPHVPGIKFAGTVESSRHPRYAPGDEVILTAGQQLSDAFLDSMILPATLRDLPALGEDILAGRVRGRVVVDVNT
jgi:NADPH:quinone reductase-like Zn-dependent oxidoreductase